MKTPRLTLSPLKTLDMTDVDETTVKDKGDQEIMGVEATEKIINEG